VGLQHVLDSALREAFVSVHRADGVAGPGFQGGAPMDERLPAARTVHMVLPATHRSLCGYGEEHDTSEGASAVVCPECAALLRSGLVPRRPRIQDSRQRPS
jgi:hypothetical protein